MRRLFFAVLLTLLGIPSAAKAQTGYLDPAYIPRVDVGLGFNGVISNAPPANCNCFSMNGAFASVGVPVKAWLSGAAEVTRSRSKNIGPLGQDLTLMTYTAGPRLVLRFSRFRTFAQAMAGVAHGTDSYFPSGNTYSTRATSLSYSVGLGADYHLSRRFDIRPVQLQYLHTGFPNGHDNAQSHLFYSAGVVLKFKGQMWMP